MRANNTKEFIRTIREPNATARFLFLLIALLNVFRTNYKLFFVFFFVSKHRVLSVYLFVYNRLDQPTSQKGCWFMCACLLP